MDIKNAIKCLSKNFPLIDLQDDCEDLYSVLEKYIVGCDIFKLKDFIKNEKNFFGLVPADIHDFPEVIEEISENNPSATDGGYTRFFIEKLYNHKFHEEYNKVADNSCCDSSKIVNSFMSKYPGFITEKKVIEIPGNKKTEKIDNPYSAYKVYGQGKYSEMYVGYKYNTDSSKKSDIDYLLDLCWEAVEKSVNGCSEKNYIPSETEFLSFMHSKKETKEELKSLWEKIRYLQIMAIHRIFQSFTGDYVPLSLESQKTKKSNNQIVNMTLLEDIFENCKWIFNQEVFKYRLYSKSASSLDELSVNGIERSLSKNEIHFIKKHYLIFREISSERNDLNEENNPTIKSMVDQLQKSDYGKGLYKYKMWQNILEFYKIRPQISLNEKFDNESREFGDCIEYSEEKLNYEKKITTAEFSCDAAQDVYDLFEEKFSSDNESDFLETIFKYIKKIDSRKNFLDIKIDDEKFRNLLLGSIKGYSKKLYDLLKSEFSNNYCIKLIDLKNKYSISDEDVSKIAFIYVLNMFDRVHSWRGLFKIYSKIVTLDMEKIDSIQNQFKNNMYCIHDRFIGKQGD